MGVYDKIMLGKRSVIECVKDMVKNVGEIVDSGDGSLDNLIMNILGGMGGYWLFCRKGDVKFEYEIGGCEGEVVIWG